MAVGTDVVELTNSSTISFGNSDNPQATQISKCELHLWKRQAKAIGRSPKHLQAITRLLQLAEQGSGERLEISERTAQMQQLDLQEFNRQAFRLMKANNLLKRVQSRQLKSLVQKIRNWWQACLRWAERFVMQR